MAAAPMGRGKKRFLALSLSLGLALLAAELLVRARYGAPLAERLPIERVRANPVRGWEMVPGEHYTYQQRVHVSSLGLRGPELGPRRPGEARVLFLGDSLVYGQGVGEEETVAFALETALARLDPARPWTVVNGGLRAYGTEQELGLLTELGARIQPDVVVLGWYWNDVSERPIAATYEAFKTRGEFAFDTGAPLEGLARVRWQLAQIPRRSALVMLLHDLSSSKGEVHAPEVVEAGFARLPGLLARFRDECARLGAVPVVALFPDAKRLLGREETRALDERAAELARATGLAVVELLPALVPLYAARGSLPVLPFDGHYDAEANRALGAHLAERLLALGVPARGE
jgi:lysophospholipase L1-like esterase